MLEGEDIWTFYSEKELTEFKENNKKSGIVRGADYYRKGETTNEH